MVDIHNHSRFSFDSKEEPRNCIETAISKNGIVFGFSEHLNMFNDSDVKSVLPNFIEYANYLSELEEEYKNKIIVVHGLEINFYPSQNDKYIFAEEHLDIDYVINSIHGVGRESFYLPQFFIGKDENIVAGQYLDEILLSLQVPYDYQIVGHIGTISKLFTKRDKNITYSEFPDKYDAILKYIIEHNKALEINTNFDGVNFFPHVSVIQRYYDLGGRIITIGGDAHNASKVYQYNNVVIKTLKEIGFEAISYYKNKIRKEVKI